MADTRALVDVLLKLRQLPAPQGSVKATKATPATAPMAPSAPQPRPAASALAVWTGPVAPAHDPRVARVDWSGHPFAQGKPWGTDEDTQLRQAFLDGANLLDLARTHGRTPGALALRLEKQGLVAAGHPYAASRWRS